MINSRECQYMDSIKTFNLRNHVVNSNVTELLNSDKIKVNLEKKTNIYNILLNDLNLK